MTRKELIKHLGLKPCVYPPIPDSYFREPHEPTYSEEKEQEAYSETMHAEYIKTGKVRTAINEALSPDVSCPSR